MMFFGEPHREDIELMIAEEHGRVGFRSMRSERAHYDHRIHSKPRQLISGFRQPMDFSAILQMLSGAGDGCDRCILSRY